MNDSNVEDLLIQMVEQNAVIIDRLGVLVSGMTELRQEFDWVKAHSFGMTLLDELVTVTCELQRLG